MNKSKKHSNCTPIECQETAAWADIKKTIPESKVPIPSQSAVVEAKEWVEDENQK
ncbi:CDIF630_02480 family spore surface protein [Alkalithermobacter thermoalcaliphilus]